MKAFNYRISLKRFLVPEVLLVIIIAASLLVWMSIKVMSLLEETALLRVERVATMNEWLPEEKVQNYARYRDYCLLLGMSFSYQYDPGGYYEPIVQSITNIQMNDKNFFPDGEDLVEYFINTGDFYSLRNLLTLANESSYVSDASMFRLSSFNSVRKWNTEEDMVDIISAELKVINNYVVSIIADTYEGKGGYQNLIFSAGIYTQLANMKREIYAFALDPPLEAMNATDSEDENAEATLYVPSQSVYQALATLEVLEEVVREFCSYIIPPEYIQLNAIADQLNLTTAYLEPARELDSSEVSIADGIYTKRGEELVPIGQGLIYEKVDEDTYNLVEDINTYEGTDDNLYVRDNDGNYINYAAYLEAYNQMQNNQFQESADDNGFVSPNAPQREETIEEEEIDPNKPFNFDDFVN